MNIVDILTTAKDNNASDIFLIAGAPVTYRCNGNLTSIDNIILKPNVIDTLIQDIYTTAKRERPKCDDDFTTVNTSLGSRFRYNVFRQRGSSSVVVRVIEFDKLQNTPAEIMGIPDNVLNLTSVKGGGLILISGNPCCGKTTTAAYMIDKINREKACHIITIEDPIEYLHKHSQSLISQRELSIDVASYSDAMYSAVRESPNVIFIGELRDKDSIVSALNAADTGVLVISTVHAQSSIDTIGRVLDMFSGNDRVSVSLQIARVLKAIVNQELLPSCSGDRSMYPVFEVLVANTAVRTLIRNSNLQQLSWVLKSGKSYGMISFEESLMQALTTHKITKEIYDEYIKQRK